MQYMKIKFMDPKDEAKVFIPLLHASRVVVVKEGEDEVFIVLKESLAILDQKKIPYQVLGELGFDGVVQALRNSLASHIQ